MAARRETVQAEAEVKALPGIREQEAVHPIQQLRRVLVHQEEVFLSSMAMSTKKQKLRRVQAQAEQLVQLTRQGILEQELMIILQEVLVLLPVIKEIQEVILQEVGITEILVLLEVVVLITEEIPEVIVPQAIAEVGQEAVIVLLPQVLQEVTARAAVGHLPVLQEVEVITEAAVVAQAPEAAEAVLQKAQVLLVLQEETNKRFDINISFL